MRDSTLEIAFYALSLKAEGISAIIAATFIFLLLFVSLRRR